MFDELKNQWGFAGFCSQKAVVSECAARLLLMVYNLWAMFARVTLDRDGHTEAITSRYELLMVPSRLVLSGRKRSVKLAVSGKFARRLKAAYERLKSVAEFNCAAVEFEQLSIAGMDGSFTTGTDQGNCMSRPNCGF